MLMLTYCESPKQNVNFFFPVTATKQRRIFVAVKIEKCLEHH